jgi:hypothetical protein
MAVERSEIIGAWCRTNTQKSSNHFHLLREGLTVEQESLQKGQLEIEPICDTGGGDLQTYSEIITHSQDGDSNSSYCEGCKNSILALQQGE